MVESARCRDGNWHLGNVSQTPKPPFRVPLSLTQDRDFADAYPSADVIGIDITPTQPGWVPPNLRFEIEDAQLDWTFEPESFDFIHIRYMHGVFDDWNKFYRQVYKSLKPGGWFQQIEPDIEMRSGDPNLEIGPDQ